MHYQLEHVAVYCRDINESIKFYEKFFGGSPTAIRKVQRPMASAL